MEWIEAEIAHLRHRTSVRNMSPAQRRSAGVSLLTLFMVLLLGLFFMDPIVHSFKKETAIHTYLYLRNSGSEQKTREILATGIFTANEIDLLNHQHGSFQDYFPTPQAADASADSIARYFQAMNDLRAGNYARLDGLGKIRYQLFVRFGLIPPRQWRIVDPSVHE